MLNVVKSLGLALGLLTAQNLFAQTTNQVWNHHIKAWQAKDLDGIASDYNDQSILILNNKTFRGPEAIRKVFAQLFRIFDNGVNKIDDAVIDGRIVYITWHLTPNDDNEFFGTDTFVIEDGKISVQTIASSLYDSYLVE